MKINDLEYLMVVAETNSISAAAKKLYLSQTGLSSIINSIEEELSITIFKRTSKGVMLTSEGAEALRLIQEITNKSEELLQLHSASEGMARMIHLGMFPSACRAVSLYLTHCLVAEYPKVSLHCYEVPYKNTFTWNRENLAKIALAGESSKFFNPEVENKNGLFNIEPLYVDNFCAIVSKDSTFFGCSSIDINELQNERLALTDSFPLPQNKAIGHVIHGFQNSCVYSNLEIAKSAVVRNNMVIIAPSLCIYNDLLKEIGLLKAVRLTGFSTEFTNFLIYDANTSFNPAEQFVIAHIREFFETLKNDIG